MTRPGAAALQAEAEAFGLILLGAVAGHAARDAPEGTDCLLLLGPRGPAWPAIATSPEFADGAPDPLDRWSRRVIGGWAAALGAAALFPFGGPPWHPFQSWAVASGRAVASPVGFLCHVEHGLMVSYRGALALPWWPEGLPGPAPDPCATCAGQPCRAACPPAALTAQGYDVDACHGWLAGAGTACLSGGCQVRLACPLSAGAGRLPAQSAFHMRAFHP